MPEMTKVDSYSKDIQTKLPVTRTNKTIVGEKMDAYFSVFNCHLNDADKRATMDVIAKFGVKKYAEELQPFQEKGIMSIFKVEPTDVAKYYVDRVEEYVNENRR